ncbi:SMI1/KNR4 family protein [Streptomyces sp. NPDC012637]|uniref:SMI1/KNR4 family protein n=1 Tax=Streptomyces sp. NPDC012637 TaxID=3364842 RepID=UPI0036EC967A
MHFANSPIGGSSVPTVHPPTSADQIAELQRRFNGYLEPSYREFLLSTDGMQGDSFTYLGCRDWTPGGRGKDAAAYLKVLEDADTAWDVGIPRGVALFPVAIDEFGRDGIFMLNLGSDVPYRFWRVGGGSSSFFVDFYEVLAYMADLTSLHPVETLD